MLDILLGMGIKKNIKRIKKNIKRIKKNIRRIKRNIGVQWGNEEAKKRRDEESKRRRDEETKKRRNEEMKQTAKRRLGETRRKPRVFEVHYDDSAWIKEIPAKLLETFPGLLPRQVVTWWARTEVKWIPFHMLYLDFQMPF